MSKKTKLLHEAHAINKDFILMTIPLFIMAMFLYGPKILALVIFAVVVAKLIDRLVAKLRSQKYDSSENSSVLIALLIVLMMPATISFRIVFVAIAIAILIGKEAFGGYGSFPFNPAAVGFCVVGVCWPETVFKYPQAVNWVSFAEPTLKSAIETWSLSGVSVSAGASNALRNGGIPQIDLVNMVLGNYAAPLGVSAVLIILSCAIFLVLRKRLPLYAPVTFLITIALLFFIFPRVPENIWDLPFSESIMARIDTLKFEIFSSTALFTAVFLVSEPCTMPKNKMSQVIYGFLLGGVTVFFRYFGVYDVGVCFAILIVNATSGYFDRAVANFIARKESQKANRKKGVVAS